MPYSFGNYISNLLLWAPTYLMPIIAVNHLGAAEGSYFYAAWSLGLAALAISISIGWSLFAEGSSDERRLARHARRSLIAAIALGVLALATSYLGGRWLLLAFGSEYAERGHVLLTLTVLASIPAAVTNTHLNILRVNEQLRQLLFISLIFAVVSLGFGWMLLERIGLEGGALGLLAGYSLSALVGVTLLKRPSLNVGRRLARSYGFSEDERGLVEG